MSTPDIQLRLRVQRDGFQLAADLVLPGRGVAALFGHSGSGKTTLLRAVAGLDRHPGASLSVHGEVWQDDAAGIFLPPHRRPIGYVFQEASLFPHLSVQGNLDFARQRAGPRDSGALLASSVALLGIGHLLARPATTLSGGERQRVAIARALLSQPRLLLLDEPLASLDHKRKEEVLPYLEHIHEQLDIPMLYVSHAMDEVARLADHLVLLDGGQVTASGPAADVLARLDLSAGLADDAGTLVDAVVDGHDADYGLLRLRAAGALFHVARSAMAVGGLLRLRILARDVSLALAPQADSSILNQVPAIVAEAMTINGGAHVMVRLDAAGTPLLARITRRSRDHLGLVPGMQVWALVKATALAQGEAR